MFSIPNPTDTQLVFIAVVAVGSIARLARLLVHDHWPPVVWLRRHWDRHTDGWNLLLHCHFCIAVWLAFAIILWGHFTDWNLVWWLINGSLAASYAAAFVVTYDGDDG